MTQLSMQLNAARRNLTQSNNMLRHDSHVCNACDVFHLFHTRSVSYAYYACSLGVMVGCSALQCDWMRCDVVCCDVNGCGWCNDIMYNAVSFTVHARAHVFLRRMRAARQPQ